MNIIPESHLNKNDATKLCWRLFAASCVLIACSLFIACSLAVVLYILATTSNSGLRADVKELRDGYIQLVPKSEFNLGYNRLTADVQSMKVGNLAAAENWSSRLTEQERKTERLRDAHKEQIDVLQREVQKLREQLTALDKRTTAVPPKD